MSEKTEALCTYIKALPKRGNANIVDDKIWDMMGLFAEVYDKNRRDCRIRSERMGGMRIVFLTSESEEAQSLLTGDPRFLEIVTDLQAYCKRLDRNWLMRLYYQIEYPNFLFKALLQR